MRKIVFVMPLFGDNARRYLRALLALDGASIGLIHQQPIEALHPAERRALDAQCQVADSMNPDQLVEACRRLQKSMGRIDRLVGFLEQTQGPIAAAREALGIEGIGREVARNFRDKDRMKAVLREAGLPVARSRRITSNGELQRFVGEVGLPIVVKPLEGLGSRATFRVQDAASLQRALAQLNASESNPWQAEEFITGEEYTFEAITLGGQVRWWSGTRYYPGPLQVLENPWIQYAVLLPRVEDSPQHLAFKPLHDRAIAALGLKDGITHMEWFRRKDGSPVISEVAARPPGVHIMPMMSHAHNTDMIAAWAGVVGFERFTPRPRTHAVGTAFFRGQGKGERVVAVRGLEAAQQAVGAVVIDRQLPVVGQPRSSHYEGEGWAMVKHPRTDVVRDALFKLVSTVRVDVG